MADQPAPAQNDDFDKRHAEELSAKHFAKTKTTQFLIPLAAGVGAGFIGYHTLGGAAKRLLPQVFKNIDHFADIKDALKGMPLEKMQEALATFETVLKTNIENIQKTEPYFKLDGAHSLTRVLKKSSEEDILAVKEALGAKSGKHTPWHKWAGAGALGFIGNIMGGIFVGYGNWRKDESARLAAGEIDRDISRLEVFAKRDPELVAENKRLRAMLEDAPPAMHTVSSVAHEGKLTNQEMQRA